MSLSAFITTLIFNISYYNLTMIKILVDTMLFIISYLIQRILIFNTIRKES